MNVFCNVPVHICINFVFSVYQYFVPTIIFCLLVELSSVSLSNYKHSYLSIYYLPLHIILCAFELLLSIWVPFGISLDKYKSHAYNLHMYIYLVFIEF